MFFTIYKITNLLDGKFYIGKHQTKNLDDGYLGSGKMLKRAITKHGKENFKKEILEIHKTEEAMNAAEKRLVIVGPLSYNLCEGGNGGFGFINKNGLAKGNELTAEQRTKGGKISGKIHGLNYKSNLNFIQSAKTSFLGKTHSEEARRKISEARKKSKIIRV